VSRALLAFLGTLLAVSAQAADDPSAIAQSVGEKFVAACGAGDVKAVVAMYRKDARVVYPGAGESATNPQELERIVTTTCAKDGPKVELVGYKAVWIDAAHTVIGALGDWRIVAKGADGKTVTTPLRATEVIVKTKSGWQYVVDHASVGAPPPPAQ